jgi:hypothetical protein
VTFQGGNGAPFNGGGKFLQFGGNKEEVSYPLIEEERPRGGFSPARAFATVLQRDLPGLR